MAGKAPIEHERRWPVASLADIATKIGSGATPKGGADAYLPTRARYALVRSQNVFDRRFDHAGLAFITDEQAKELRSVVLQPGDVLLNITGDGITFGRACIVPADALPACVNQHVSIIRIDPGRADAGYVLAFLTHPEVKKYIESFNAGGSRRAVTKGHIESFQIPLPPLDEQRAIAHILGKLDDKIELNRRMSETLEAMARALFKSWFVDFDPVRAKTEGRDPGLPNEIANLFPGSFEESELGEIPKGWRVDKVSDLATFSRTAISPCEYPTESFDHYSLPAFDDGRVPKAEMGSTIMSNKLVVTPDSVLLSKLNPHIPRVWMPELSRLRRSVCSTEFMVARAMPGVSREYLFSLFTSSSFSRVYGTLVTGTTGSHQRIKAESVKDMKIVTPPRAMHDAATHLARPMFERINRNIANSRTLAALRDALLPKLLSGELRVGSSRRLVEGVSK